MPKIFQVILKEHRFVHRPVEIVFTEPVEKKEDPSLTIRSWHEYTTRVYDVVATDDDTAETVKQRILNLSKEIKDESYETLSGFEIENIDFIRDCEWDEIDDDFPSVPYVS